MAEKEVIFFHHGMLAYPCRVFQISLVVSFPKFRVLFAIMHIIIVLVTHLAHSTQQIQLTPLQCNNESINTVNTFYNESTYTSLLSWLAYRKIKVTFASFHLHITTVRKYIIEKNEMLINTSVSLISCSSICLRPCESRPEVTIL